MRSLLEAAALLGGICAVALFSGGSILIGTILFGALIAGFGLYFRAYPERAEALRRSNPANFA